MKGFLALLAIIIILGGLFATKPNQADFERQLESVFAAELDKANPDPDQKPIEALIVQTCRLTRSGCYQLLRSFITVDYTDMVLYSKLELTFDRETTTCYGLLNQAICPDL